MRRFFERFGAAALTPISVLPAAAIILALGHVMPIPVVALALSSAGATLFRYLGLIFAVGLSVGLTGGEGMAALSAAVSYIIINGVADGLVPGTNMGVVAGLVAGLASSWVYSRYHDLRLPEYLSFFGGRRSVPIIASLFSVPIGLVMGNVWPALQGAISSLGLWMGRAGTLGVFVYGGLERLLIPTGLHHFLNGIILLMMGEYQGVTGDLGRFFAGDVTAGYFMAGAYAVKLFGLPAAAYAMYVNAGEAQKRAIKGLMITAALTSILTGITEPVEFTFLFTAPILFVLHILFTGLSFALCHLLGIRHGFGSSAGLLEFVVNWHLAEKAWLILPLGAMFALIYFFCFNVLIRKLDLKTPGRLREEAEMTQVPAADMDMYERALRVLKALGGIQNVVSLDSCLTRLRVVLKDTASVDEAELRASGALGLVKGSQGVWQVVFGTYADELARTIRRVIRSMSA
ncbi:MAG: PTS transporter subunit EIIC [Bacillota bacterium]